MTYYNTTHLAGADLRDVQAQALTQTDDVLNFFRHRDRGQGLTPWEVCAALYADDPAKITSVRRSITNLTEQQRLIKTGQQRKGPRGANEYVWKLARKSGQLAMFG